MVVGFDLVNEEDASPSLDSFLRPIYEAQKRIGKNKMRFFIHAGESLLRSNNNLYDAILLGAERIGHGFSILKHPSLIDIVKEKNICLEICPVSNHILGYAYDLRTHPARSLLSKGVKISLNPDDQGFFNEPSINLDYITAYISWDLTLADLKQLCLNSLHHASITRSQKESISLFF